MNAQDFKFFEELLKRESGLIITLEKVYLLESRLLPVASRFGIRGLEELAARMRQEKESDLLRAVVEAMTTNETSFFRDNTPFQRLKEDVLPAMISARSATRTLRIWSAACSSGQEPYSIAMLLREYGAALAGWKIEIVATDLSLDILAQAKSGVYTQFEVQRGLPIQMLVKYFMQAGDKWNVRQELKDMISFRTVNLLQDIGGLGQFDIVFCRNVLIYFDIPTKAKVLQSIKGVLRQDGVLFLGGAETVIGITEAFKTSSELKGVYFRNDTTFAAPKKAAPPVLPSGSVAGKATTSK